MWGHAEQEAAWEQIAAWLWSHTLRPHTAPPACHLSCGRKPCAEDRRQECGFSLFLEVRLCDKTTSGNIITSVLPHFQKEDRRYHQ